MNAIVYKRQLINILKQVSINMKVVFISNETINYEIHDMKIKLSVTVNIK